MSEARRPLGLKAILAYKFAMAPVMLALGLVLVLAPAHSLALAHRITRQISELGSLGWRAARALEPWLSPRAAHRAAVVPGPDGLLSLAEGLLPLSARTSGQGIVIARPGAPLPIQGIT